MKNYDIYYRGEGIIERWKESVEISLPDNADKIAHDFTIHITPIYGSSTIGPISTTKVVDNKFTVYGNHNNSFFWTVHGTLFKTDKITKC